MRTNGNKVVFTADDAEFIQKFGLFEGADMVMDYRASNKLPFIYDSLQLSGFLGIERKALFKLVKSGCTDEYKLITIKKKNGKSRLLQAPSAYLKYSQRKILTAILSKLPVSQYATAYKKGVGLSANAAPHVGKRYLLKIDITDFFGNIRFEQVYSAAFNTSFFPKNIGYMLTAICCYKDALPQGAPTSPALSNLVMKNFDNNIGNWCKSHGISYTRYCDDMTFSSDKPLYNVFIKAKKMLDNMGFDINEKKTCFITNAARQSVTGLTVNEKISISREYKRALRQEIYYILKFGAVNALEYKQKSAVLPNDSSEVLRYLDIIEGKINYILSVEPENSFFIDSRAKISGMRKQYLYYNSNYITYYS